MRVLKIEKGKQEVVNYPRADQEPVFGLGEGIEFYAINENIPGYDNQTQRIEFVSWELTTEKDTGFKHLNVANKIWEVKNNILEKTIDEKVKDLEELIIVLTKNEKDRTAEDNAKIDEIKDKIEMIKV